MGTTMTMSLFGTSLCAALHGKTLPKHRLDGQPVRRKVSNRSICWELLLNELRHGGTRGSCKDCMSGMSGHVAACRLIIWVFWVFTWD